MLAHMHISAVDSLLYDSFCQGSTNFIMFQKSRFNLNAMKHTLSSMPGRKSFLVRDSVAALNATTATGVVSSAPRVPSVPNAEWRGSRVQK
jgi:hypothetical protein